MDAPDAQVTRAPSALQNGAGFHSAENWTNSRGITPELATREVSVRRRRIPDKAAAGVTTNSAVWPFAIKRFTLPVRGLTWSASTPLIIDPKG